MVDYAVIYLVALVTGLVAMPLLIRAAFRFSVLDAPAARKLHREPVPLLGGLAIFLAMAAGFIAAMLLGDFTMDNRQWSLLAGSIIITVLGLVDDTRGTGARAKLFVQIIAAAVVYAGGIRLEVIDVPGLGGFRTGWVAPIATILWIVAITNAMNLLDGLDGLAGGVSVIATMFMASFAVWMQQSEILIPLLALNAGCLAFLIFNFPPAKVFMGDTGSLLIGFFISAISLLSLKKGPYAITILIPIVLLSVPIIDTLLAILRRARNRTGIFQADKLHLHHRILELTGSYRLTLLIIYAVCFILGGLAWLSTLSFAGYKLLVFLVVYVVLAGFIFALRFAEKKKND